MLDDQAPAAARLPTAFPLLWTVVTLSAIVAITLGVTKPAQGQVLVEPAEDTSASPPSIVADEETTRAALLLLNNAVTVQIDGRHHALLRALRHLRDPELAPLFAGLSAADRHPSLRIHGLLGNAELSASQKLGVDTIAQVRRPDLQAELIGAALDGNLLDDATIETLLSWPGLDPAVKLLLATPRVASGTFDQESSGYSALLAALNAAPLGQRGLAGLLLHELEDPRGTAVLDSLTPQAGSTAEAVTAMLLETAWTHGLRRSGDWALRVAEHEGTAERVQMLAFKVSVRFGQLGADQLWAARVAQAAEEENLSRRTRLALVGLEIAPWLDADRFEMLTQDTDPLIARLGRAGKAVATYRQNAEAADAIESEVVQLIESAHPQVWRWAADYARETNSTALGQAILEKYQPGESRGRSLRLEAVVNATRVMLAGGDDEVVSYFMNALQDAEADETWQRAVLLGMIRDRSDTAQLIAEQLPDFIDRETESLALVLRTQTAGAMSEADQKTLEQLIQDDAPLDDSLRVQTAWAYLDRTDQGRVAIAALLAPGPTPSAAKVRPSP